MRAARMFQVTFMDCGRLFVVSVPSYEAAEALYFSLPRCRRARLWNVSTKQAPQLLA